MTQLSYVYLEWKLCAALFASLSSLEYGAEAMNYLVDLRHEHGVAVLKYSGVLRVLEVAQYGYSILPLPQPRGAYFPGADNVMSTS